MTAVPTPPDEAARLATLLSLGLLDRPRDPAFDELTRFATDLLDVPIALVTLVDDRRQWFASAVGLELPETPREHAFCAHAIARDGLFEVRDASQDLRFRDNPLVTGEPRIRFYAGMPLRVDGHAMGTLCVIAREPRRLDMRQRATLERLASLASNLLAMHRDRTSIRGARERLADFLASSGDWLWETRGLRVGWVSGNVSRVLGVEPDAYRGHLLLEGLVDDDAQAHASNALALSAIRAQRPFRDLVVRRAVPGGERIVSKSGVPVRGADGAFAGWRGVARDVTAAVRARGDAARAERRLREAVEALDEPFAMTDPDGRIVLTNARWRAANLEPGAPVPERWDEHLRGLLDGGRMEVEPGRRAEWLERRTTGRGRSLSPHEARVAGRDYLISDLMLSDGSCVTVGQDITAMRAEQRATLDAVRRLELALSVAGLSICEADPDADTIRVVAGETPDDGGAPIPASLRSALSSIVPEDRERFESGLRDVWEGRRNACRDEVTVERGGAARRVRFDVALARDPHGPGRRLVAARADVTALRQAEAAARQKTAADLANRAKSDFLSRVGHELRTPLNAIRGLAQVLQRETADDGASRHALVSHIVGASEHLAALLDDLLDTSQVEAGRVAIRAEPTPLAPLVRECLRMMAPQAAGHGIALESARVPDGLRVMADATRLRQILLNLLSNAVKYNRPQGRVRLEASADPGDGFARIAVSDTGPGLSRDEAARVFRPFERLAREGTPRDGLGLGLSIAQGLAQAMGGAIEVASEPGHGATFTVRLPALPDAAAGDGEARPGGDDARADGPAAEEAVAEGRSLGDGAIGVEAFVDGTFVDATLGGGSRRVTADAAADPPTYRPPGGTPPRRVLYVEDNRLNGVLMKQIARQVPGLVMQVVETGEEALAMMASFSPDLLLLDNDLPGMSGLETHRMLKADPRWAQLPAVLVSADATADAIARARALGFDDYWVKPLDVPRVIEALGGAPGRTPTGAPTGA